VLGSATPHSLGRRNGEGGCRSRPLVSSPAQDCPGIDGRRRRQVQNDDEALGPVKSMLPQGYSPTLDDLRTLPLEGRKLWSLRPTIILQNQILVRRRATPSSWWCHSLCAASCSLILMLTNSQPIWARKECWRNYAAFTTGPACVWTLMLARCRQCEVCAISRGPLSRPHGHLHKVSAGAPMDIVAIDILSGLPATADGYKYLLVATDYFTKWLEEIPL